MKASRLIYAFLLLLLCLPILKCSKDPPSDQDPEEEDPTEICVPELLGPLAGAQMDNGCSDSADLVLWTFYWEDCENSSYNLVVQRSEDPDPLIEEELDEALYTYQHPSAYIADSLRFGWTWKVRAIVDEEEGDWSEQREFRVETVNWDCEDEEGIFTDPRDGQVYKTIRIGNQVWMAENLRATVYSDAAPIALVEDAAIWEALDESGAYCWYENNSANQYTYGALYNYHAATNGEQSSDANPSGVQGVCPSGWHLPGDEEWKELERFLGMRETQADRLTWRGTNEGTKLAGSEDLWISSGILTEDIDFGKSAFNAVPAGHRNPDPTISDFADLGSGASWWTATATYAREIQLNNSSIYRNSLDSRHGFSVRCVRD